MNNRTKVQIILCVISILNFLFLFIIQNDLLFIILTSISIIGTIIGIDLDTNNEKVSKWFDKTNFFNKKF